MAQQTPKEKAEELFSDYRFISSIPNAPLGELKDYMAKQCSLRAVDEIIESRKDDGAFDDTKFGNSSEYYTPHPMYLNYWNLVKTEIEKL
jgi:hypothetical protein